MNQSDITGNSFPSPTMLIAAANTAGTTNFTASYPVEVTVSITGNSSAVSINGIPFGPQSTGGNTQVIFQLAKGQSLAITLTASGSGYLASSKAIK